MIEKAILAILNYHIKIAELNNVVQEKNNAVWNGFFEKAAELRDIEDVLRKELTTVEQLKEIRDQIINK